MKLIEEYFDLKGSFAILISSDSSNRKPGLLTKL